MTGRASKWRRRQQPERIALQPRDKEILCATYSFRILSREQIERLFNFGCTRRVNVRLRKLYDHHYLSRFYLPTVRGSAKAIYYLGPQGSTIVSEKLGLDLEEIKRKRKSTAQLKEIFLAHTMEINDTRIAFSLAVNKQPEMKLERWINDNDCQQSYGVVKFGKKVDRRFRPDGYFRIWVNGKIYSFFLEHDRSTMTLGRFQTKARSYLEFAKLGYYRQRFGMKYFRILVTTLTEDRLWNLKKAVEQVTDKLFWFTTLEQIDTDTVFGPIWQRNNRQGNFSLIDL